MTRLRLRLPGASVLTAALALTTGTIVGQDEQPAKPVPIMSIRATGVQQLLQQWPNTRIGKLMADEDVVDARDAVLKRVAGFIERRRAVLATFGKSPNLDGMEPYEVAYLYNAGDTDIWQLFRFPTEQVESAEMQMVLPTAGQFPQPLFHTHLACSPRYEGKWTQAFEQEARDRKESKIYTTIKDAKIAGFPAYMFKPIDEDESNQYISIENMRRWMLHLPGHFHYGGGFGNIYDASPTPKEPEIACEIRFDNLITVRGGMAPAGEIEVLGLDTVKALKWSGRFVGELIQDELSVALKGEPKGMIKALVTGSAPLPAQAVPKGALAQMRVALNLETLAALIKMFPDGDEVPEQLIGQITKAFDGGIAFSCCSPAPGGVIPRMFLTLNVADEAALNGLFQQFLTDNLPTKKVTFSGIECTILKIPNVPNGIQPAFCVHEGKLHLAESGRSLRSFLKLQGKEAVAMDVGDAPMPVGDGDVLPLFDFRFDEAALYENFYEHWLPLWELSGLSRNPIIRRRDMPEPDIVAEYLGKTRGVLRKTEDGYAISLLGALGGPEAAAILMTWGPMIGEEALRDYRCDMLSRRIAIGKLEAVHDAIDKFVQREQRRPKTLAELFTAQKLAADALLLPGDDLAEDVKLADGRTVRSSFRYYVDGAPFNTQTGNDGKMIFIEVRPRTYSRIVMTEKGAVPDVYGPDSSKPIDQFQNSGTQD